LKERPRTADREVDGGPQTADGGMDSGWW